MIMPASLYWRIGWISQVFIKWVNVRVMVRRIPRPAPGRVGAEVPRIP
jgi:hypothetical protein